MDLAYLDNAATTPVAPDVAAAMQPYLGAEFGNPSSRHPLGVRAAEAVDRARAQVGHALGVQPPQVIFTSGGTEANNLGVMGLARARARHGSHVVVGPTEHPSVRNAALALLDEGAELDHLRLDADGALDTEDLVQKLRSDTVLVALMLANNELGNVYPIKHVARLVHARSPHAALFVDAVQAFGKLECAPAELGADCVSLSSHKIHGPKGVGALVMAEDMEIEPLLHGGGQERNVRSGTENVPGIVGFGLAAQLAEEMREETHAALTERRALFIRRVLAIPGARAIEPGANTVPPLPSIASVLLPGVPAEVRMHHLEARGVLVSSGSACQAGKSEVSETLRAAGLDLEQAKQVLRFSFSRETTADEVERAAAALAEVSTELG
jgi:cysteine desulfurase